jgi:hypothetical protein
MRGSLCLFLVCSLCSGARAAVAVRPRLAVLPLAANRVPAQTVEILNDLLTTAMDAGKRYEVLSVSDINAMIGFERLKDLTGCSDVACGAEIGGALGVELLVSGSVSILGDELIVQVALIDTKIPKVVSRGRSVVKNDEKLYRKAVEAAAAQVSGAEPQEPVAATPAAPGQTPAPRPPQPTSPARYSFETRDAAYDFQVTVTTQGGESHGCKPPVRAAQPCTLQDLAIGEARLNVSSGTLTPFLDGFTVRNKNELYPIEIESRAGEGSVVAWGLGGTTLAAGAALLGVGIGTDNSGMIYGGAPAALVGLGVVIVGFFFERRIDVNYPGIDALF